jgi:hypothetical protein
LKTIAKLSALAAAAALSIGLTAAPGQAATAASTDCPAKVNLRSISVTSWSYLFSTTVSQTCNADWASWDVADAQSAWQRTVFFDRPSWASESIYIYDSDGMGKWTLHPSDAYDAAGNPVPQATQYFYVKYGSRASLGGYRSGNYAYLRVHATRYSPNANYGSGGWTAFGGRSVTFQYRFPGSSTWHYAISSTTSSIGYTAYKKVYAGKGRNWRAIVTGTSTTWGRTTAQLSK